MDNLGITAIFKGCNFEHKAAVESKGTPTTKPKQATIDKVVDFVARTPNCDRITMLAKISLSSYGLDNCVRYLVGNGVLNRKVIGMCGPKEKSTYTLNQ